MQTIELKPDDIGWNFRSLPGFRKVAAMKRQAASDKPESVHVMFSDGLASISVFIEPGGSASDAEAQATVGPVNVFRRQVGEYRVVVMGEVPALAVRRLGESMERKRK